MILLNNGSGNTTILRLDKNALEVALTQSSSLRGVNGFDIPGTEINPFDLNSFVINKPTQVINLPNIEQTISLAVIDTLEQRFDEQIVAGQLRNVTNPSLSNFSWNRALNLESGLTFKTPIGTDSISFDLQDLDFATHTSLFSLKPISFESGGPDYFIFSFSIVMSFDLSSLAQSNTTQSQTANTNVIPVTTGPGPAQPPFLRFGQFDPLVKISTGGDGG
ncbi:MAG: hypothetical protein Roseis2KO_54560 [Roseivirga sp.]